MLLPYFTPNIIEAGCDEAGRGCLAGPVFAAAVVTAACFGAQLKKPLAVAMLTLICFPATFLLWTFFAALICEKLIKWLSPIVECEGAATEGSTFSSDGEKEER